MTEVLAYMDQKGFSYTRRNGEAVLNCPFCGDQERKFSINLETGLWQCFHANRCGLTGNLRDLKNRLGDAQPIAYQPREYTRPPRTGTDPGDKIVQWFREVRKIVAGVLAKFRIGEKDGAIVFPFYCDGELVNQKYRAAGKKIWQDKDARPTLFGRDLVPEEVTELIITEGEIDTMTLHQLDMPNSVSVPSGAANLDWIETEWPWLERFETLYLCFDNDNAGEEGAQKAARRLGTWRCRRVRLRWKDPNEGLQNGMTQDDFSRALISATDMGPSIVRLAEDFAEEMLREDRQGIDTGFPLYDAVLGGQRSGELTVITGRNGDGKTTWLNQVILNLLMHHHEQHACIASFEMRPARLLRWMMGQAGIIVSESGIEEFWGLIGGRLSLIDTQREVKPDELFEAFEYVARRAGTQTFVIDSLIRVDLGGGADWLENQKQFMNRLAQFALTFEAHIYLVAHPRKGSSDGARIDKVDIAGSGDISNFAWNVVSIRRIVSEEQGRPAAVLQVLKNRDNGRLGTISLNFDEERKRFTENRNGR